MMRRVASSVVSRLHGDVSTLSTLTETGLRQRMRTVTGRRWQSSDSGEGKGKKVDEEQRPKTEPEPKTLQSAKTPDKMPPVEDLQLDWQTLKGVGQNADGFTGSREARSQKSVLESADSSEGSLDDDHTVDAAGVQETSEAEVPKPNGTKRGQHVLKPEQQLEWQPLKGTGKRAAVKRDEPKKKSKKAAPVLGTLARKVLMPRSPWKLQEKRRRTVYFANFEYFVKLEKLRHFAARAGQVESARFLHGQGDLQDGKAVVVYKTELGAQRAIDELHGMAIKGRKVTVRPDFQSRKPPGGHDLLRAIGKYEVNPNRKVLLSNLPTLVRGEGVAEVARKFGNVTLVRMYVHQNGFQSRIAVVEYKTESEARSASEAMFKLPLLGKYLVSVWLKAE